MLVFGMLVLGSAACFFLAYAAVTFYLDATNL